MPYVAKELNINIILSGLKKSVRGKVYDKNCIVSQYIMILCYKQTIKIKY
jgi:hypothetical protein